MIFAVCTTRKPQKRFKLVMDPSKSENFMKILTSSSYLVPSKVDIIDAEKTVGAIFNFCIRFPEPFFHRTSNGIDIFEESDSSIP